MEYIDFLISLQRVFDILMMALIIIVYSLHIYYRWEILKVSEKTVYSWLLIYFILVSALFVLVFAYLLVGVFLGKPIMLTSYGILFIRPVIFLTGCILVSSARATLLTIKLGGCLWKLQKPKI